MMGKVTQLDNLKIKIVSFLFDGLWKNKWKIHISIAFFHDLSENYLHFFEEMGNENIMSF